MTKMFFTDDIPDRPTDPEDALTFPESRTIPFDPYEEQRQTEIDRGSLDARLSAMIRHIDEHNCFDKRDLIALLKQIQRERASMGALFKDITNICESMLESPHLKRQAE